MNEFVEQVKQFQQTYDPTNLRFDCKALEKMGTVDAQKLLLLRLNLVLEETDELQRAMQGLYNVYTEARQRHLPLARHIATRGETWHEAKREFADALGDVLVVVIGTALSCGLDIEEIMRRIHTSNMSKLDDNGKVIRRKDGKVLKGPHFQSPQLEDLI